MNEEVYQIILSAIDHLTVDTLRNLYNTNKTLRRLVENTYIKRIVDLAVKSRDVEQKSVIVRPREFIMMTPEIPEEILAICDKNGMFYMYDLQNRTFMSIDQQLNDIVQGNADKVYRNGNILLKNGKYVYMFDDYPMEEPVNGILSDDGIFNGLSKTIIKSKFNGGVINGFKIITLNNDGNLGYYTMIKGKLNYVQTIDIDVINFNAIGDIYTINKNGNVKLFKYEHDQYIEHNLPNNGQYHIINMVDNQFIYENGTIQNVEPSEDKIIYMHDYIFILFDGRIKVMDPYENDQYYLENIYLF